MAFLKLVEKHGPNRLMAGISRGELSQHAKETDCWISIDGTVFDITLYLGFHPGGRDELLAVAGKDCTQEFYQVHPWVNFKLLLGPLAIGPLEKSDELSISAYRWPSYLFLMTPFRSIWLR